MNKTAAMLEQPLGLTQVELGKMFSNPVKENVDYTHMYRGRYIPKNSISNMIIGNLKKSKNF
jgi:hypothetical protein